MTSDRQAQTHNTQSHHPYKGTYILLKSLLQLKRNIYCTHRVDSMSTFISLNWPKLVKGKSKLLTADAYRKRQYLSKQNVRLQWIKQFFCNFHLFICKQQWNAKVWIKKCSAIAVGGCPLRTFQFTYRINCNDCQPCSHHYWDGPNMPIMGYCSLRPFRSVA